MTTLILTEIDNQPTINVYRDGVCRETVKLTTSQLALLIADCAAVLRNLIQRGQK